MIDIDYALLCKLPSAVCWYCYLWTISFLEIGYDGFKQLLSKLQSSEVNFNCWSYFNTKRFGYCSTCDIIKWYYVSFRAVMVLLFPCGLVFVWLLKTVVLSFVSISFISYDCTVLRVLYCDLYCDAMPKSVWSPVLRVLYCDVCVYDWQVDVSHCPTLVSPCGHLCWECCTVMSVYMIDRWM